MMVFIFLLFELGLVGFMFVGMEIFVEKKDGVISVLVVMLIEWRSYILVKMIIMSVFLVIGVIFIMVVGMCFFDGFFYVIVGVFLCFVVYIFFGIVIFVKYCDLDDYFILIMVVLVVLFLFFVYYYGYLMYLFWKVFYFVLSYLVFYFFKVLFVEVLSDILVFLGVVLFFWLVVVYYVVKI